MPYQSRCLRCPDENNDENNDDNNNDRVWQGSARPPPESNGTAKGTRMSKLLTGALAGALLLDEARTFTLRNSEGSVTGGNIVAVDHAVATLGVGMASITVATAVAADPARAHKLPANTVLDVAGTSIAGTSNTHTLITGAAPTCTVTPDTAAISSSPVVVTATISLPKSPTAGCENSARHGSVNLTNLMVTPTQD